MNDTVQMLITIVAASLQPMGEEFAKETGFDAGEHVRDLVAQTENTLDDSVVEVLKAGAEAFLRGLEAPAE